MTEKEFDKICLEVLGSVFSAKHGFRFVNGTFFYEKNTGLRQLVIIDFDPRSMKTFRVIVGLNASAISGDLPPEEAGALCVRYLNWTGLGTSEKKFPCFNRESALSSLKQVGIMFESAILPWFSQFESLSDLASGIEESYLFFKGKLFLLSGDVLRAEYYLRKHIAYLESKPQSPHIHDALLDTKTLLNQATKIGSID